MANIAVRDASGVLIYMNATGTGTNEDPFIPANNFAVSAALPAGTNLIGKAELANADGTPTDFAIAVVGAHSSGSDISSKATLTKPEGATGILIQANTKSARFTLDGTDPTATVGFVLIADQAPIIIPVPGTAIEIIQTAATCDLEYQWIK